MRRAFDIAFKDLRVWARDPAAMGILLGMPAILILILGSALGGIMSGGGSRISVAIVNLDSRILPIARPDDQAAKLEDALTGSSRLKALFVMQRTHDLARVEQRIANGELSAALVIPKGFGADLAASDATLLVLKDPGAGIAAGIWESVVKAVATRYSAVLVVAKTTTQAAQDARSPALSRPGGLSALVGMAIARGARDDALDAVKIDETTVSGSTKVSSLDYYSLSMTAMFLMFGAMFGAFSTINERREQTMDRMLASPTPKASVVGGKMLGVFLLGMVQFVALYVFTRFMLHVEWGANPLATFMVGSGEVAAVTGLATLIASLARTARAAGGIGPLLVQIQALVGGAFFPVTILPPWIQPIRYLSIVGWTMEGWRRVQVLGHGVSAVLVPTLALLAFSAVFFAFGVWRAEARG